MYIDDKNNCSINIFLDTVMMTCEMIWVEHDIIFLIHCKSLFYFLGTCSDDDFTSSTDSRESSSGRRPPRPPSAKYRKQRTSHHNEHSELTVDISANRYKDSGMSSGLSSGDPSPNMSGSVTLSDDLLSRRFQLGVNRSSSSSSIDVLLRKPRSGTTGERSAVKYCTSSRMYRYVLRNMFYYINHRFPE